MSRFVAVAVAALMSPRPLLSVIGAPTAVTSIVTAAAGAGMTLADVQIQRPDLESVFLHLTGKALRD